jgi:hypothetical protein
MFLVIKDVITSKMPGKGRGRLGAVARTSSLPLIIPTAFQPSAEMRESRSLDAGS